jgi:hypothetical protein
LARTNASMVRNSALCCAGGSDSICSSLRSTFRSRAFSVALPHSGPAARPW